MTGKQDGAAATAGAALAADLAILARLHDREPDEDMLAALKERPAREWFSLRLEGPEAEEAFRLVGSALAEIHDPADTAVIDDLSAEYAAIYLTHAYRAAPTESVWRDEEGLERQAAMFMVRSWYEHYGVEVPDWRVRSDDHLVHELEFLAFLCESGGNAGSLEQAARFLRQHPLAWMPEFCRRVVQRCRSPLYAGFALLTHAYLERLADFLKRLTGEDMTPAPMELPRGGATACGAAAARPPTCGDPPERYVPGVEPSW